MTPIVVVCGCSIFAANVYIFRWDVDSKLSLSLVIIQLKKKASVQGKQWTLGLRRGEWCLPRRRVACHKEGCWSLVVLLLVASAGRRSEVMLLGGGQRSCWGEARCAVVGVLVRSLK